MQPRRWLRLVVVGLVGLILLCISATVLIYATAPPSFKTHRATIAYSLTQRGIAFQDIQFQQSFEERNNLLFYQASIQVIRPDGSTINGWIGCENQDRECFLDLRALDINGLPLPELTPAKPMPNWYIWVEQTLREIGSRNSKTQ